MTASSWFWDFLNPYSNVFKLYLFYEKWLFRKKNLIIFCLLLKKLINGKHFSVNKKYFSVKEKFGLVSRKVFFFILDGKHFPKVVKNLKISYYLLIISNLVLKLLIYIYIYTYIHIYILFCIFVFQFHSLEFNFYINFGHPFICFFLIIF